MRYAVIVFIITLMLAACGQQENNKDTAATNGSKATNTNSKTTLVKRMQPGGAVADSMRLGVADSVPGMGQYLIPMQEASAMIRHYHDYLRHRLHQDLDSSQLSFMLDADVLRRYLNNNPKIVKLDMYLAMTPGDSLTLIYTGAEYENEGDTSYREQVITKNDGQDSFFVMDRAMPCPKCDKEGLHTYIK